MKKLLLTALCSLLWTTSSPADPGEFDFGFIASRSRDIHGVMRLRALGPFFERATADDGQQLTAVRPLYSRFADPANDRVRRDYLWPLAYDKRFRQESSGRYLLAFWNRFDVNNPTSRYRFWLFPLYFQGRDQHGQKYAALFPLGGSIHEFLGQDKINFVLFPLYLKHSVNEVTTKSFVWPIYSKTEGKGIYRFRIFPFYGQSRHRDSYNKKFVMWPIYTSAEYYYPGSSGKGYIVFPLWGYTRLDDQRSFMILPPFFRFTRSQRVNMTLAPWPFFQRKTGEVKQLYLFPLLGEKIHRGVRTRFFLWPILHEERIDRGPELARRLYILPFYYSDVHKKRQPDPKASPIVTERYHKIWPLGSYLRVGESMRFRTLDLWPLKNTPGVERNWAPFWTLFSRVREKENVDTELLWGLFRREVRGPDDTYTSVFPIVDWERGEEDEQEVRSWNLLKGLIGYERKGMHKRYRLLYFIRWGRIEETTP